MKIKLRLKIKKKSFLIMVMVVFLVLIINIASAGIWDDFLKLFSDEKTIDDLINDDVYKELILNDEKNADSIITIKNPMETIDILRENIKINFIQECGKVDNYKLLINDTCIAERIKEQIFDTKEVCDLSNKSIEICYNETYIKKTIYENYTYDCFKEFEKIDASDLRNIKIEASINWDVCSDGTFGYKIDWIPGITFDDGIETITLDKKEWEWWNVSYDYKREINCTNMDDLTPIVINGSNGFEINGENQIVWTYCFGNGTALYYNNYDDYTVANDSGQIPFGVEFGNETSYNPTDVWDNNYIQVLLLNDLTTSTVDDSTSNNNDGVKQGANEPNEIDGFIGKAQDFDGTNDYIDLDGLTIAGTTQTITFWTKMDVNEANVHHWDTETGRLIFQWNIDGSTVGFYDGGASWIEFGATPTIDGWHYVVLTLNGTSSESKLYINMTQSGSTESYTPRSISDDVTMGVPYNLDLNGCIDGKIDHWTVSNIIRSNSFNNQTYLNAKGISGYGDLGIEETSIIYILNGTVKDSNDVLVNNATIIIINQADNTIVGTTNSNSTGSWNYTVNIGTYLIVAYDPNNSTRDGDADPYIIVS